MAGQLFLTQRQKHVMTMPYLFHSEKTRVLNHDMGNIRGMINNQKLVYTVYTHQKYPSIQSASPASSLLKQQVSK
jgi:hypothetical protein